MLRNTPPVISSQRVGFLYSQKLEQQLHKNCHCVLLQWKVSKTLPGLISFLLILFINTKILQTFQSKTLRKLANAPWYISNITLNNDLRIPYVIEVIRTYAKNHKNRTAQNKNQLIRDLFNQPEIGRRLNRMWPEDLIR
jgi:hypothetical protein